MTQQLNVKIALRQIANTLLLNAGRMNGLGLFNGKMGIALFFYHYTQIDNHKIYSDFADELLDNVVHSLNGRMPVNFADGLTGIAWAINYLIENKFIEADGNVLEDMDEVLNNHQITYHSYSYENVCNEIKNSVGMNEMEAIDISKHVDTMLKDVYRNLNLYNGLAGVGLALMEYEKNS